MNNRFYARRCATNPTSTEICKIKTRKHTIGTGSDDIE